MDREDPGGSGGKAVAGTSGKAADGEKKLIGLGVDHINAAGPFGGRTIGEVVPPAGRVYPTDIEASGEVPWDVDYGQCFVGSPFVFRGGKGKQGHYRQNEQWDSKAFRVLHRKAPPLARFSIHDRAELVRGSEIDIGPIP